MKHITPYHIYESVSQVEALVPLYQRAKGEMVELGSVYGVRVIAVDRALVSEKYPEWEEYIGSHHWGKRSSYIDPDAVWVAQGLSTSEFIRVVNHELIEREAMRALQDQGMTPEESWSLAHPMVKSMGF